MKSKKLLISFLFIVGLIIVMNYFNNQSAKIKLETRKMELKESQLKYLNLLMKLNSDIKNKEKIRISDSLIIVEKQYLDDI